MSKDLDLKALFQLPVRQIQFSPESEASSRNQDPVCPVVYHPVKLKKVMGQRFEDEGELLGLDYTQGFELIPPDTDIPPSIMQDLLSSPDEPTKCELLLVIAMYNEGVDQFKNTLRGIANNLHTFVKYGIHPTKIACTLIVDGIVPFLNTMKGSHNRGTYRFFRQFFDEDLICSRFGVDDCRECKVPNEAEHDEFAHCFMQNVVMDDVGLFPLQFLFTIKQKNKRKLNTHLWFFGGFCEMIQPKFVMLVDVGTQPCKNSLFYLYEAMVLDQQLAGCCGEIKPMNSTLWKLVVPAQEVEYKFSHIFDKALESLTGYITVLPGAFSAYRWEALQGSPLWNEYFKSICHPEEMGPFNSNIYLAEDRVLCLSLVSKKDAAYKLRYVRGSIAETDVPENIGELMSQRRRWINGSWFALIDSLKKFKSLFRSDHSACRKIIFALQMVYYYITVVFSWFLVGSFYMVFYVTVEEKWGTTFGSFGAMLVIIYTAILVVIFTLALSVKPRRANDLYKGLAVVLGFYILLEFYLIGEYLLTEDPGSDWSQYLIMVSYLLFGVNIVASCSITVVARGLFHFIFMIPTYVNVFLIYAICNTHDCSWGNRPDQMTSEQVKRQEEFEEFRSRWTIIWVLSNCSFAYILIGFSEEEASSWYVYSFALFATLILAVRTIGGLLYLVQEECSKPHLKKHKHYELYREFEADRPQGAAVAPRISIREAEVKLSSYFSSISPSGGSEDNSQYEQTEGFESSFVESSGIGEVLRYAREELNMSTVCIAEQLGISVNHLKLIEEGQAELDPDRVNFNLFENHS